MNYLQFLTEDIHTTVAATTDSEGVPVTCAIDMMDYDDDGLYFLTAKGKGFYNRLKEHEFIALTGMKGEDAASRRYADFIQRYSSKHMLFLELGVGMNTPVIIKYPFWRMTANNPRVIYACLNLGQTYCPPQICQQSVCIDGDIGEILTKVMKTDI